MQTKQTVKKTMFSGRNILIALVAAFSVNSVLAAGFINEQAGASNQNRINGRGTGALTGSFGLQEWDQKAPNSGDGVALSLAIIRLLPPNHPPVEISSPEDVIDQPVKWAEGLTRRQALEKIAVTYHLRINVENRKVSISGASIDNMRNSISNASSNSNTINGSSNNAFSARESTSGVYDVRLTDIKLSTAMNRWAKDANVRIRWDADKHVLVGAPMTFNANNIFDAVAQALSTPGIKNSDYPLEVCQYPNTPPLLRITRQGDQVKDCPGY